MEKQFRIHIAKDRLRAEIIAEQPLEPEFTVTKDELLQFLQNEKVVYGIKEKVIEDIAQNPHHISYPITVAEGTPPKAGHDAYLVNEIKKADKREKFHFRNVMEIPSVKNGQLLASIIPATPGTHGKDIYGNQIKAKDGRPLRMQAGKNVLFHLEQFFATTDGQISITDKAIHVNPVYEVRGDLDMKTGNIDFIGNVVIRGNVPTGYQIKAGGDIKVYGLVEGAILEATGSIIVSGGISGENRGKVVAGANIQAAYMNQANVTAGADIIVTSSIMHSEVTAVGCIHCENGSIIGGKITAESHLFAKEIGNHLFTKTYLFIGSETNLVEKEQAIRTEIKKLTETIKKLNMIERKFERAKQAGSLSQQQLLLLSKQKVTINQLTEQLFEKDEELKEIEAAIQEESIPTVCVRDTVYPNTHIQFGKYAKVIQKEHQNAKFWFDEGDIRFSSYL